MQYHCRSRTAAQAAQQYGKQGARFSKQEQAKFSSTSTGMCICRYTVPRNTHLQPSAATRFRPRNSVANLQDREFLVLGFKCVVRCTRCSRQPSQPPNHPVNNHCQWILLPIALYGVVCATAWVLRPGCSVREPRRQAARGLGCADGPRRLPPLLQKLCSHFNSTVSMQART